MRLAWYAIRVRSNFEPSTNAYLTANGWETFLPTYAERRRWSDRVKQVEAPLFPGYVFCHMDIQLRQMAVRAPGFVNIVRAGGHFLPVPDSEIAAVRAIVNSPVWRMPWPYLSVGERVIIQRGPLAGVEGILVAQRNEHRLIVSIELLQRSIAADVSLDCVRPLNESIRIRYEIASGSSGRKGSREIAGELRRLNGGVLRACSGAIGKY
jgi:transcription antitermination factor NusG